MTRPIWRGKGPITYSVGFGSPDVSKHPEGIEECWKYDVCIGGSGEYEDVYLADDFQDFVIFAETKEGAIRDLAKYIEWQGKGSPDKEEKKWRKECGLPPQYLNLDNVEIYDYTDNNDFHDIDVPAIFANAEALQLSPIPLGERPFIATVRDQEHQGYYDIGVSAMDPVVYHEFENTGQYATDSEEFYNIPTHDVNKTIMGQLSKMDMGEDDNHKKIVPTISNTKLINFSKNPEFTLQRLFAMVSPLQVTRVRPALQLIRKAPNVRIRQPGMRIPVAPMMQKENVPLIPASVEKDLQQIEKEKQRQKIGERERLRA